MAPVKAWAIAALLALFPSWAAAQQAQPAQAGAARTVNPEPESAANLRERAEVPAAPSITVPTEAEVVTTPRPMIPPQESLAPPAPPGATGLGSVSPTLPEVEPVDLPRMQPDPYVGQPQADWNLQRQFTPIGERGRWMNDVVLLPAMVVVTLIVFALLFYAMVAFRRKDGVEPSKTSHNTTVEVIWTLVPVLILFAIGIPSFQLLASQYDPPAPDLTIKATGHQWYWEYEYPDLGGFSFDSIMLPEQETAEERLPRLLDVDNRVVVPAGATVKVLVTASDVLHSWAVPSFWVKMDAVPGRINETWFKVDRPGVYYGQCSELCGTKHAFMPIAVEVLPPAQFAAWVRAKQVENGIDPAEVAAAAARGAPGTPFTPAPAAGATGTVPDEQLRVDPSQRDGPPLLPAPAVPPGQDPDSTAVDTPRTVDPVETEARPVRPVEPGATPGPTTGTGRNSGTRPPTE